MSACWKQLRKMVTSISILCSLSCPPSPPPSSVSFISLCLSLPCSFFVCFGFMFILLSDSISLPPSINPSIPKSFIRCVVYQVIKSEIFLFFSIFLSHRTCCGVTIKVRFSALFGSTHSRSYWLRNYLMKLHMY